MQFILLFLLFSCELMRVREEIYIPMTNDKANDNPLLFLKPPSLLA